MSKFVEVVPWRRGGILLLTRFSYVPGFPSVWFRQKVCTVGRPYKLITEDVIKVLKNMVIAYCVFIN